MKCSCLFAPWYESARPVPVYRKTWQHTSTAQHDPNRLTFYWTSSFFTQLEDALLNDLLKLLVLFSPNLRGMVKDVKQWHLFNAHKLHGYLLFVLLDVNPCGSLLDDFILEAERSA